MAFAKSGVKLPSKPVNPSVSSTTKKAKPSDRLNPKTVDPFSSRQTSAFAAVYQSGGVPCRLVHGSVKHKLAWDIPVESVCMDPVLVTLAQGLQETTHPYMFIARNGFKELLEVPSAGQRCVGVLNKVVPGVRAAMVHREGSVFEAGLEALVQLSSAVGPHLNPHLKLLLVALSKRSMDRKYKDEVTVALQQLEQNGGPESLPIIKSKVPTYNSVMM